MDKAAWNKLLQNCFAEKNIVKVKYLYQHGLKTAKHLLDIGNLSAARLYLEELYKIKPVQPAWIFLDLQLRLAQKDDQIALVSELDRLATFCEHESKFFGEIMRLKQATLSTKLEKQRLETVKQLAASSGTTSDTAKLVQLAMQSLIANSTYNEDVAKIAASYYMAADDWLAYLVELAYRKEAIFDSGINRTLYGKDDNQTIFTEYLLQSHLPVLIVEDEENKAECQLVQQLLRQLSVRTIYFAYTSADTGQTDALTAAWNTCQVAGNNLTFTIVATSQERAGIQQQLFCRLLERQQLAQNWALVMGSGNTIDALSMQRTGRYRAGRLTKLPYRCLNKKLAFGWVGDYLGLVSYLYKMDVEAALRQPARYDFSIVIPVHNATETLEYTLKTCLEQEYAGTYEIVVSDNSDKGNDVARHSVERMQKLYPDKVINYYKAPHELYMVKNFEYGFLRAKGNFIFSLGSDDGVYPWTLQILAHILPQVDCQVVQWGRSFYAWPSFALHQANQLTVQLPHDLKYHLLQTDLSYYLHHISDMYLMPMLYINSGCRKTYLWQLYEQTGMLWNGASQDLMQGMVNNIINGVICFTDYPLTVAGMSGTSNGYLCTKMKEQGKLSVQEGKLLGLTVSQATTYIPMPLERQMPRYFSTDTVIFYMNFLRCIEFGLVKNYHVATLWQKIIEDLLTTVKASDKYSYFYYMAISALIKEHSLDTQELFEAAFKNYNNSYSLELPSQNELKSYHFSIEKEKSMVTLDASDYQIDNIYSAIKLNTLLIEVVQSMRK